MTRTVVAFEVYGPSVALMLSETLSDFRVVLNEKEAYFGRAVVHGLVETASLVICEVKLDEPGVYVGINMPFNGNISYKDAYRIFFRQWQNQTKIIPEFKLAVLDIQSYLSELKLLLEQIEISVGSKGVPGRKELEASVFHDLVGPVLGSINAIHERFETIASQIPPESREDHEFLVHRQLHPLFLCSPFGNRTFYKPLGHAGDYEIMNIIHRNTFEGSSLFSKAVHYRLVNQWAAKSVRNRVAHMKTRPAAETARVVRQKRTARILNLGCGPAREVQEFIAEHQLASNVDITFLDFDTETLNFVTTTLDQLKTLHRCHATKFGPKKRL